MTLTPAEKVRATENRKKALGLKEIRIWVPDRPADIKKVRDLAADLCAARAKSKPKKGV